MFSLFLQKQALLDSPGPAYEVSNRRRYCHFPTHPRFVCPRPGHKQYCGLSVMWSSSLPHFGHLNLMLGVVIYPLARKISIRPWRKVTINFRNNNVCGKKEPAASLNKIEQMGNQGWNHCFPSRRPLPFC